MNTTTSNKNSKNLPSSSTSSHINNTITPNTSPLPRKRRRTDQISPLVQCNDCQPSCSSLSLSKPSSIEQQQLDNKQDLNNKQDSDNQQNENHNKTDKDNFDSTSNMASADAQARQKEKLQNALLKANSSHEKEQIMQQFYAQERQKVIDADNSSTHQNQHLGSQFPGKGARQGCDHYARNCWIKANCCQKYYPCRRCHDENEDHEINRHDTRLIACVKCGDEDQPVSNNCRTCNTQFARYFCQVCKFYDDTPGKEAYHCQDCGICRVGKGIGIDNHHCHTCNSCIPIDSFDQHPCREASLDANCPICTYYLATSTDPVVFMRCGHAIHVECFNEHTSRAYTCPICNKSLTDMTEWNKQLDERIERDVIPIEYQNRMSKILCHDCNQYSDVPFHFVYHKCAHCQGYNTRVVHQYDREPNPNEPTIPVASASPNGLPFPREHSHAERATT